MKVTLRRTTDDGVPVECEKMNVKLARVPASEVNDTFGVGTVSLVKKPLTPTYRDEVESERLYDLDPNKHPKLKKNS